MHKCPPKPEIFVKLQNKSFYWKSKNSHASEKENFVSYHLSSFSKEKSSLKLWKECEETMERKEENKILLVVWSAMITCFHR